VIAASRAVVQRGGILRWVHSEPPLTLRQVRADRPEVCALCVVGSAAGPLAGDQVRFDLVIEAGAMASLESVGALLAQGRWAGPPALVDSHVTLGPDAVLTAAPQPVVACAGGRVEVGLHVDLDPSATLQWRELLVLGRTAEPPGAAVVDWDVRRGGVPLLRQRVDLSGPDMWSGLLQGRRVLASELRVGPEVRAVTRVRSDQAVTLRVDEHCELTTVLADDAESALVGLDALRAPTEPTAPTTQPVLTGAPAG
jgi:urease accessory protein